MLHWMLNKATVLQKLRDWYPQLSMVGHTYHSSSQKAEAGESQILSQPTLQEILFPNKQPQKRSPTFSEIRINQYYSINLFL